MLGLQIRRLLFGLVVFLYALPSVADSPSYYLDSGRGLESITVEHARTLTPSYWTIRLYKRGQAASGGGYWGSVTGATSEEVMTRLRRSQDFQKEYARWAGRDYNDDLHTFFNYQGPIAVIEQKKSPRRHADRVVKSIRRLEALRRGISKFIKNPESANNNPYRFVGAHVRGYAENLMDAEMKLSRLQTSLLQSESDDRLLSELSELERALNLADEAAKALGTAKETGAAPSAPGMCGELPLNRGERCCYDKEVDFYHVCSPGGPCPPFAGMECGPP